MYETPINRMDALVLQPSCPPCRRDRLQSSGRLMTRTTRGIFSSGRAGGDGGRHSLGGIFHRPCCLHRRRLDAVSSRRAVVCSGLGGVHATKPPGGTPVTPLFPAALCFGGAAGVACRHGSAQAWLCPITKVRGSPVHNQILGYMPRTRGPIWWHGSIRLEVRGCPEPVVTSLAGRVRHVTDQEMLMEPTGRIALTNAEGTQVHTAPGAPIVSTPNSHTNT